MLKNKKGISPLIATVLLVGLVVVVAFLIYLWYGKYLEDVLEKQKLDLETACAQDVEFVLSFAGDSCLFNENYFISFHAENTGRINIRGFKVSYSATGVGGSLNTAGGVSQAAGDTLSIEIIGEDLSGKTIELDIIPIIGFGSEIKNCDSMMQHATIVCNL